MMSGNNIVVLRSVLMLLMVLMSFPQQVNANVPCNPIQRNLKQGMSGVDVLMLQKILNAKKETQISLVGPGSPGKETTFFGLLTRIAVEKYQEIYRSSILTPSGISQATGYVGAKTLQQIERDCTWRKLTSFEMTGSGQIEIPNNSTSSVPPPPFSAAQTQLPATPVNAQQGLNAQVVAESPALLIGNTQYYDGPPQVFYPSPYVVHRGEKIILSGMGFLRDGNTVHVGARQILKVSSVSSQEVEVLVPNDMEYGKHSIWVTNQRGESNKQFVVVTEQNAQSPLISAISPTFGPFGTEVTITGSGFGSSTNEITFMDNTIMATSYDGKALKFNAESKLPGAYAGADIPGKEVSIPVSVYLSNKNGISNMIIFTIKL